MRLRRFQKEFVEKALSRKIRTAVLSLPRGNGKTTLTAWLAVRALTPGDRLFREGAESFIVAASVGQAQRTVLKQVRLLLPDSPDYRISDSSNNTPHITHKKTNTKVTVLAANHRTAQGIVGAPWIFCDEPGSWQTIGGESMFEAIKHAAGKPGSELTAVFCGTLAPAQSGWWHDLIARGTRGSAFVMSLKGDPKKWDRLGELKRVNPLMWGFANSRDVLREELRDVLKDTRLKASFLSFRMNLPTADESAVLLAVADWEAMCARVVPERDGRPVVGVDLGGGRAWSAAVAVYPNGRSEALACAPGIPDIRTQEKRDRVPKGTYQRLVDDGILHVSEGLRVQPISDLVDLTKERDWDPVLVVADKFRLPELMDSKLKCPVVGRRQRWSESSEDIRALRKLALDGPLTVEHGSRPLLAHSLAVSMTENDSSGNVRMVKKTHGNTSRDDVAVAWALAAGRLAMARERKRHSVVRA